VVADQAILISLGAVVSLASPSFVKAKCLLLSPVECFGQLSSDHAIAETGFKGGIKISERPETEIEILTPTSPHPHRPFCN
jgi:hypothetical protein